MSILLAAAVKGYWLRQTSNYRLEKHGTKLYVTSATSAPNNIAAVAVFLTLRGKRTLMVRDVPESAKATRLLKLA